MGYETKLVFVTHSNKSVEGRVVGYCCVIGTMDLSKCAYDDMGDLIEKCRTENKALGKDLHDEIEHMENVYKTIFDHDGEYVSEVEKLPKVEQNKKYAVYSKLRQSLEKKLPFFYADNGNDQIFEDRYGDVLLVAGINDVKKALIRSNAKSIAKGEYELGYRRFNAAIKMIEGLENFGEEVSVVLFGH